LLRNSLSIQHLAKSKSDIITELFVVISVPFFKSSMKFVEDVLSVDNQGFADMIGNSPGVGEGAQFLGQFEGFLFSDSTSGDGGRKLSESLSQINKSILNVGGIVLGELLNGGNSAFNNGLTVMNTGNNVIKVNAF